MPRTAPFHPPAPDALTVAVTGHVLRVMRADGFTGTVTVSGVESAPGGGFTADVLATVGAESAPYTARLGNGRVTVTRVGERVTAHRLTSAPGASIAFCACGQGFSGARVAERAAAHVESPDGDSLGALLIGALSAAP